MSLKQLPSGSQKELSPMPPNVQNIGNVVGSKLCSHAKPKIVFKTPIPVWAGAGQQNCPIPKGALLLDLADMYTSGITGYGIDLPKKLKLPKVHIEWPDMGRAHLSKEDWLILAEWLKKGWHQKGIYVACAAGHGRTGTALAILGTMLGAIKKGVDPITFVRDYYCEDAVESMSQIAYIEEILGIKTKETGSIGTTIGSSTISSTPCLLKIVGKDNCEHTCYATSYGHTMHWCRKCKWDWKLESTGKDTWRLVEEPGPELKTNFPALHKIITDPAPPINLPPTEEVKSAKESADTFLAHGFESTDHEKSVDDKEYKTCNFTMRPSDGWCSHMCWLWMDHSGMHECEFCQKRFGAARLPCSFRWENNNGCTQHACELVWGHSTNQPHECGSCDENAPGEWSDA